MDYETLLDSLFSIREEILSFEENHMEFKTSRLVEKMVKAIEGVEADSLEKLEDRAEIYDLAGDSSFLSGRRKLACTYYEKAFEAELLAVEKFEGSEDALLDRLSNAVVSRNYLKDDDCGDLKNKAKKLVAAKKVDAVMREAIRTGRDRFRYDPVELTTEYLKVIDSVEEKVYRFLVNEGGGKLDVNKMFPHRYWKEKKKFLKLAGIDWRTPSEMNPGVRF